MHRLFIQLMSILLIPVVMLCSLDIPAATVQSRSPKTSAMDRLDNYLFSYDDVLALIEEIEEGNLEQKCSSEHLEKINYFLAYLARAGLLPDVSKEELEEDIEELFRHSDENVFSIAPSVAYNYSMVPAACLGYGEVVLCKSWCKKTWHHTKKFVKKHKTAILIGVAAVAAAAVVVCVASAYSAASAVAAAAGTDALTSLSHKDKADSTKPQKNVDPSNFQESLIQKDPLLIEAVEEQIATIKEIVADDALLKSDQNDISEGSSIGERIRGVGAYLAHQVLDGVGALTSIIPESIEEIRSIGSALLPESYAPSEDGVLVAGSPMENWNRFVQSGHEKIDELFSTEQADLYSSTAKEARNNKFVIGLLPPPGLFSAQNIKYTEHAIQRSVERGVSQDAIVDALNAPLKVTEIKIDHLGRPSQRFIGKTAEVVINPETEQVVSVNPTSTKKAEKLMDGISNDN